MKPEGRIGISGWTYPPWRGVFYPPGLAQTKELSYASRQFNSIEINGTHYALQRPEVFRKWYDQTPEKFVFSIKGSRYITHLRRGSSIGSAGFSIQRLRAGSMGRMRFRPWGRGCLMVRLLLLTATMKSEYVPLMRVRLGMAGRLDCAVFTMPRVVYCIERQTGICRKRTGRGFCYIMPDGKRVGAGGELSRIASLRIPPAWTDVWISPDAKTHLQATGRDSMGRLQYLYHAQWRSHREQLKFERLLAFARFLPAFRRRARIDARQRGMGKQKVLAAVCNLLDRTLIGSGTTSMPPKTDPMA